MHAVASLVPYQPLPIDQSDVRYEHGPDSVRQPGVRVGQTVELSLSDSAVYPGTSRRVWVHVPAGYDAACPAAVVVFQDGWWYLDPEGEVRGGIVLDNLVAARHLPMTIGVFVDPGVFEGVEDPAERKNRNAEYDAFDDRYVTCLLDEVLPQVRRVGRSARTPTTGRSAVAAAAAAALSRPPGCAPTGSERSSAASRVLPKSPTATPIRR